MFNSTRRCDPRVDGQDDSLYDSHDEVDIDIGVCKWIDQNLVQRLAVSRGVHCPH